MGSEAKQPCGHPAAYVVGKTTMHCTMCALEAERDAALERVRELTEWRPMESAPRDREILVLMRDGSVHKAGHYTQNNPPLERWATDGEFYFMDSARGWLPLPGAPE